MELVQDASSRVRLALIRCAGWVPFTVPLLTAINPYHLATREVPAMAALVLGTRSVTILPHPASGSSRECVGRAVQDSPRYLRLLEAWRWSSPLWRAGVIASAEGGDDAGGGLDDVYAAIRNDPAFSELRPLTRSAEALADERPAAFLDSVASDLLRGGPDPGFNIPINAALERFAGRHGMVVVRGGASSVAQRTESRLGRRVLSIGLPMLVQAGGHRLLLMRDELAGELRKLRAAITASFTLGAASPSLAPAVSAYAERFRDWAEAGAARGRGDDETGRRVVSAFVAITGVLLPADAVLRSSRAAVRSVGGYAAVTKGGGRGEREAVPPGAIAMQPTLVVRETNVAPD